MRFPLVLLLLLLSITAFCQYVGKSTSQYFADSLYSKALKEYRNHNVYLPKNFDPHQNYRIVYATDGGSGVDEEAMDYKQVLDSLIDNKVISPIIFISSYSNSNTADSVTLGTGKKLALQFRNYEYVDQSAYTRDPRLKHRFASHMTYFSSELIPTVEIKLGILPKKQNRIFYGYSNGAAFGINLLNRFPGEISTYICFSIVGSHAATLKWPASQHYPKLFIQYGSEETNVQGPSEESQEIETIYKKHQSSCEIKKYEGGHDYHIWNVKFIDTLKRIAAVGE